jgi:hypothetical protein
VRWTASKWARTGTFTPSGTYTARTGTYTKGDRIEDPHDGLYALEDANDGLYVHRDVHVYKGADTDRD